MPSQKESTMERTRIREPHKYNVVIHNDDFTPMDLVVIILMQVFFKPYEEATSLMLAVHHSDKAVAGTYSYDIAHSKAERATAIARDCGYPLRLTVECVDPQPSDLPF